jgi:hypothetical protein
MLFSSVAGTKKFEQNFYIRTVGYPNASQLHEKLLQTNFYSLHTELSSNYSLTLFQIRCSD